ncbi:MAG TPA: nodulation protein NfeD [Longimicrobiales bacterium]|nr:nodulation protein NfeD [Longimicrobiales bacterium]
MRRYACALLAVCGVLLSGIASAQETARGSVYRIPVDGVIELGLAPFIERTLREAEAAGARAVILDIETPGGRIDAAQRIVRAIQEADVPVYALVNMHAHSAGAMIALAAREVYMRPGAQMGAVTPVTGDGTKAPEKIVSAMRAEMRALAERAGRDPRVAEAMVDENIAVEGVSPAGELLTLTSSEAVALNYAREVADWDALMLELGLASVPVQETQVNWAERVVRFLTHPAVAPMLLSIGFLGIIMEIKTPAFGLAGLVGASAITAFFGSHLLLGLAGWEEIILLFAGIALIAVEMFVIPGFGIAGIAGALAVLAAFYLSMVTPMATAAEYGTALGILSLSILVVIVVGWAILRHLPRSRGFTKSGLMLGDATTKETGYLSSEVRTELIGSVGVALTDLRPSGAGRFGRERIDVVSDSNWIESGTPIRVVRSDGYRHVVEPAE